MSSEGGPASLGRALAQAALGAALTGAALWLISPWDLSLSRQLGDPRSGFGAWIQTWGHRPTSALVVATVFLLTSRAWRARWALWARAGAALVTQVVLHPLLLSNAMKLLGGRPRPIHLRADGADFAPFYGLHPSLGDFSFPSGHVSAALATAPCVLLLWRADRRRAAAALGLATAAWTAAVAWGRVRSAAHFPTDVICSMGLGVALAPLSLHLGERLWARLTRHDAPGRAPTHI